METIDERLMQIERTRGWIEHKQKNSGWIAKAMGFSVRSEMTHFVIDSLIDFG
jgi:hypothetical protein